MLLGPNMPASQPTPTGKSYPGWILDKVQFLNMKGDFGASGDGADDTKAFLKAYAEANAYKIPLYIPPGRYHLTEPIPHQARVQVLGAGSGATFIINEHEGATFEFTIGDVPSNPLQGGDTGLKGVTIQRETQTTEAIPGNYGISVAGTLGVTTFEDIEITYMGDAGFHQYDPTNAGTGPINITHSRIVSNLFGRGIEFKRLYANINLLYSAIWGNAGNVLFDGVTGLAYLPYQVTIFGCNMEFSGGYLPGNALQLPCVEMVNTKNVYIGGTNMQNRDGNTSPVISFDNVSFAEIGGGCEITGRGDATTPVILIENSKYIDIERSLSLWGDNKAGTGIKTVASNHVAIKDPYIAGVTGNQLEIDADNTHRVTVHNNSGVGVLLSDYAGSLANALLDNNLTKTPAGEAVSKGWAVFRWTGSAIETRDSFNATVSRISTGVYRVTWATPFASANYIAQAGGAYDASTIRTGGVKVLNYTASTVDVYTFADDMVTPVDWVLITITAYGRQ